jgi:protein disulfide-isomerase
MKLWLPASLLALVFSTTAQSTPVGNVELSVAGSALLTSENFNSVTARGSWFVEFYSPYCPHCRHFAPTWDEVSEHVTKETKAGSGSTAGIGMAQVNCITYGDVCSDQKVKGYPSLWL